MKVDNPLSKTFMVDFPQDAARILEQVPLSHVAVLLELIPESVSPVICAMLPGRIAACIEIMSEAPAVKIMSNIPVASSSRIFKLLSTTKQQVLMSHLTPRDAQKILRFIDFSSATAGAILNSVVNMLPQSLTVAEAIRRMEASHSLVDGDLYIVDESHKLVGVLNPAVLLVTNHHLRLKEIMKRKTYSVSVHAMKEALLEHPGWKNRLSLPVVDRDNTLLGVLDYSDLKESLGDARSVTPFDPLDGLLSMMSVFWKAIGQLLDSLFSISEIKKEDKK